MSETIRTPLFNRYEVLGELGEGGWGTVYKARHKVMGRMVALKVLPPSIRKDSEAQERFKREAMALARFDHPHIARIYDADIEQNIPYLAMELIEGRDLAKVLADKRRLSFETTIRLGLEVAEALHHIHQAGIVHRDIKPSNIIIRPDGQAVLTDFGIAFASSLPRITREVNGTPEYMSPEQVEGGTVDGLSDIYSLGVVLYKCIAGMVPFKGDGESLTALNALLQKILHEDATPLNMRRFETPMWLSEIVHRCMAKAPADRFPSGQALVEALRAGASPASEDATVVRPIVSAFPDPFAAAPPEEAPAPAAETEQPDETPPPVAHTPEEPPAPAATEQPEGPPPIPAEVPEAAEPEQPAPAPEPVVKVEQPEPVADEDQPDDLPTADAEQPAVYPEPAVETSLPEAPQEPDDLPGEQEEPVVAAPSTDETAQPTPEAAQRLEADRDAEPPAPRPPSKKLRWAGFVVVGALLVSAIAYAAGLLTPDTDDPQNTLLATTSDSASTDQRSLPASDTTSFLPTDEGLLPSPDTLAATLIETLPDPDSSDLTFLDEPIKPVDTYDSKPIDELPDPKPLLPEDMTEAALLTEGSDAFRNKDYDTALRYLEEAAGRGSAEAHYLLGWMYDQGQGVLPNSTQAAAHYQRAAEGGHPEAQYRMGVANLRANSGLKQDKEGIRLLEQAAAQGHPEAQANLGILYEEGKRTRRSSQKAIAWYTRAATQGNRIAQYNLAEMYRDGRGVAPNNREAFRWYLAAANQNDPNAQYWVGRFYWQGRGGVSQNKAEAQAWYARAAAQGHEEAQRALDNNPGK